MKNILKKYAEAGIRDIELSGGTEFYPELEDDMLQMKQEYNLNYICHAYFPPREKDIVINLASCNDEIYEASIKHYEKCIHFLKRAGCPVLSVHAGFFTEILPHEVGRELSGRVIYEREEAVERFCAAYTYLDRLCTENGIKLYLENNVLNRKNYDAFGKKNLFMLTDYEAFLQLREKLSFRFLLDLGHLHVTSYTLELDFQEQCRKLEPHVRWLHISHNDGIADQHRPLCEDSPTLYAYRKIFDRHLPVTLETGGSLEEILASRRLLEEEII